MDPTNGVPYYVLIVGIAVADSVRVSAQFDLQWAVGRLHFEKAAEYRTYADKVVDYEKGEAPERRKGWRCGFRAIRSMGRRRALRYVGPEFLGSTARRRADRQDQGFA